MAQYRNDLPQIGSRLFLTDGGIETTLTFHDGFALRDFAAFPLLETEKGVEALHRYFVSYAGLAKRYGTGLVLESPTWRASADWGARLGYRADELDKANRRGVAMLERVRSEFEPANLPIVISGCIGPRGDGYVADAAMRVDEAAEYHRGQAETFADSAADMVTAMTMNYAEEAIGIARAAQAIGMPMAVSFTVETDGRLPTGMPLGEAIERVDDATAGYPRYFMINCAHPTHFADVLANGGAWRDRIRGLRANASCKSHAELDEATELDSGDPDELGRHYADLMARLPYLTIVGGCCGTDHRHVARIAESCLPLFATETL